MAGAKLLIKTIAEAIDIIKEERYKHLKVLLLINSVKDAYTISNEVPEINSINFGGIRTKEGAKSISKAVAVTEEDISLIKELLEKGIELEIRQVPSDKKQLVRDLI